MSQRIARGTGEPTEGLTAIRSGFPFFYARGLKAQTTLQLDMDEPVDCAILQKALDQAIVRYPYFRVRIVWKDGDIYLAHNGNPLVVEESNRLRRLGSEEIGFHLMEVHAQDCSIYLHFHHGIADGNGVMPFLRTLIYCYLRERYGHDFDASAINRPDSPISPREYAEPVTDDFLPLSDEPFVQVTEDRFRLPEFAAWGSAPAVAAKWGSAPIAPDSMPAETGASVSTLDVPSFSPDPATYITHITFPLKEFVRFMKSNDASPAIMLSIFMCQAVERVHPVHEGKTMTSLVWNFRKDIGMEGSHHDCVYAVFLTYDDRLKQLPLDRQGTCFRGMTFAQTRDADARRCANGFIGLWRDVRKADGFEGKRRVLDFIGDHRFDTFAVSYTGQMGMGECEAHIRDMHIVHPPKPGLFVEVASVNDSLSIDISQSENIADYADAFCSILSEEDIRFSRSEPYTVVYPETMDSIVADARQALR